MTSGSRPYGSHRFRVACDRLPPLGFTEVRGLSVAVEVRSESNGDDGRGEWWDRGDRPVGRDEPVPAERRRRRSPTLELRRGVTDETALWDWLEAWVAGDATPQDVRVCLLDEAGGPVRGWVCRSATPVRWTGPELVATAAGVATETLELAHDGIDAVEDLTECRVE